MKANFVFEALKDVLKPAPYNQVLDNVMGLENPVDVFNDSLEDGNIPLADLIYKNHNIKYGVISRLVDYLLLRYADNISTMYALQQSLSINPDVFRDEAGMEQEEMQDLFNSYETSAIKQRKAFIAIWLF